MVAPTVGALTRRLYDRLPEFYAAADEDHDHALLRYTSLTADQASEIEALRLRIADGDLLSGANAEVAWLRWLAQLVGVRLDASLAENALRDSVTYASSGWRAGTKAGIADAARTALTGTKHTEVYDHSVSTPGDGGTWDVLLVTATTETPDVNAVLAAVVAKRAKPAGVVLHHRAYSVSWDTLEVAYPTWNDTQAVGSWTALEETGL